MLSHNIFWIEFVEQDFRLALLISLCRGALETNFLPVLPAVLVKVANPPNTASLGSFKDSADFLGFLLWHRFLLCNGLRELPDRVKWAVGLTVVGFRQPFRLLNRRCG